MYHAASGWSELPAARSSEAVKESQNEQKHLAQRRKGAEVEKKTVVYFESPRLCVSARDCLFFHSFSGAIRPARSPSGFACFSSLVTRQSSLRLGPRNVVRMSKSVAPEGHFRLALKVKWLFNKGPLRQLEDPWDVGRWVTFRLPRCQMFMIQSLADVPERLSWVYVARLRSDMFTDEVSTLRGPVGLFLVRKDGAAGSKLAQEVVGSFGYWDSRTAHFFDGVFLGWGYDSGITDFNEQAFVGCIQDLERDLDWKYRGGADLLLTDFVYDVRGRKGELDFSRVIPLDITELMEEKKLSQLSKLIEELVAPVRQDRLLVPETSVWEISDYIAALRTRKFFWEQLTKRIGDLLGWVDQVAPYAVRDLRRAK